MMNETDGRAAPRKIIAEYACKPRDCSIQRNKWSGKSGMDRLSAGGGEDGQRNGNFENSDSPELGGARSE